MFSQTLLCLNRILPRPGTNSTFILSFNFVSFHFILFHVMSCQFMSFIHFTLFHSIPFHSLHFMSFHFMHSLIHSFHSFIHGPGHQHQKSKPRFLSPRVGYLWNKKPEPRVSNGTGVFAYSLLSFIGSISRLIYQSPIPNPHGSYHEWYPSQPSKSPQIAWVLEHHSTVASKSLSHVATVRCELLLLFNPAWN